MDPIPLRLKNTCLYHSEWNWKFGMGSMQSSSQVLPSEGPDEVPDVLFTAQQDGWPSACFPTCGDNDCTYSRGWLLWLNEKQHAYLHVWHKVTCSSGGSWTRQGDLWAWMSTMVENTNLEIKMGYPLESPQAPQAPPLHLWVLQRPNQLANLLLQADSFLHLPL